MRSRSTPMLPFLPVAVCLTLACAASPKSDDWTGPAPGSAPAGSPVALHGQLRVVTTPVAGTDSPVASLEIQSMDAGEQGIDAGEQGIDAGEQGIDAGEQGIDAGEQGIDASEQGIDAGDRRIDSGSARLDGGKAGADAAGPTVLSQLVDEHGAPFQLKGVSSQWLEWESQHYPESKSGLAFMRDNWKVSVIRAAMGADADKSGYLAKPADIKKQVETMIRNAIELGVYVIVDWHTEQAVIQQDASVAFFTEMATKYGAYPNVIWEPYNEPMGYSWSQIKVYHEAVVKAIRAVDPDNLIVLGTPNYSQRVDQAAADPVAGTNLLYTLHWYSCTHGQMYRDYGTAAIAKGIALFVTEFGATFSDGGLAPNDNYVCEDEANRWFAWMAQNDVSGVAWKLDHCSDSSCLLGESAGVNGPWTDDKLSSDVGGASYQGGFGGGVSGTGIQGGQGQFIASWLRQ